VPLASDLLVLQQASFRTGEENGKGAGAEIAVTIHEKHTFMKHGALL
jgi:hypothetical protein